MAYGLRYITQVIGKASRMFTLEIWEQDYVGTPDFLPPASSPLVHELQLASDDPYEPIQASTLTARVDITDFVGDLPDLTTLNDKKYYVKLRSAAEPEEGKAIILWAAYQSVTPNYLDSNLQIKEDGISRVFEFLNATGILQVDAGNNIQFELAVFDLPVPVPADARWQLIIQADGVEVFNTTVDTPVYPSTISTNITAVSGVVYTVLCQSYQTGDPGGTMPVNETYDLWQGFILTDAAQVPFSAGRRFLELICTDGFAELKNVEFVPDGDNLKLRETLLNVICKGLRAIGYPEDFSVFSSIQTFAFGMAEDDPLAQSYLPCFTWINSDGTYRDYYSIIYDILRSFGARIVQNEAAWCILNIADTASDDMDYVEYDQDGIELSTGTKTVRRDVIPFSTTADHYFVDRSQLKSLRKGFSRIRISNNSTFAPQLIENGNLTETDGTGYYENWGKSLTGSVTAISLGPYNAISLQPTGGGPTQRLARAFPVDVESGYIGDKISLSFIIDGQATVSTTVPKVWLQVLVQDPVTTTIWWLDSSNNWVLQVGPTPSPDNRFYNVFGNTTGTYETINVTTPPLPITGNVIIQFVCDNFDTLQCTFGNVSMSFENPNEKVRLSANPDTKSYTLEREIPYGYNYDQNHATLGVVQQASTTDPPWTQWYKKATPGTQKEMLAQILLREYARIYLRSQIRFDATISGIFGASVLLSPWCTISVQDDGSAGYSVNGRRYILGNCRIDYVDNTIGGSLLDIGDSDIVFTEEIKRFYKSR